MSFLTAIQLLTVGMTAQATVFALGAYRERQWPEALHFSRAAIVFCVWACLGAYRSASDDDLVVLWASRASMPLAGLYVRELLLHADIHLEAIPSRRRSAVFTLPVLIGSLSLVPGLFHRDEVVRYSFEPLGATTRFALLTPLGQVISLLLVACFLALAIRYALAWRRRVPFTAPAVLAFASLTAITSAFALSRPGTITAPLLNELAFVLPLAAAVIFGQSRYTADAATLIELRERLEQLVDQRTRDLAAARERLYRAEKLGAVGQLAAGVAHEINNPGTAALTNLRYLLDARAKGGAWPEDAEETLADSISSVERIMAIASHIRDTGRTAASVADARPMRVAPVVLAAVIAARARHGERVRLVTDVPDDLWALADAGLSQVIENLVVNGIQSVPEGRKDGRVSVRGGSQGNQVRLVIEDNGSGMNPEVLRHAGEPFFTGKPFGVGMGLGLSIANALVEHMGGELRLESTEGRGTAAVIEIPAALPVESGEFRVR